MSEGITERLLVRLWQNGTRRQLGHLEILYPGRESSHGPDFQGAVLHINGEEIRGDVEIHLKSSQWQEHGHHQDPLFNNVVLHLVLWHDAPLTKKENGGEVPTLALSHFSIVDILRWAEMVPCGHVEGEVLDRWGEERFEMKARLFQAQLREGDGGQVLYEGIMTALGYPLNSSPMRKVAKRLPLSTVYSLVRDLPPERGLGLLETLLLQQATGLCWQTGGIRPINGYHYRLQAASHLLIRYRDEGLMEGIGRLIKEGRRGLEAGLMVPKLLGRDRAGEIAINIILPFFFALGEGMAINLYRAYPPLPENSLTRLMKKRLRINGTVNSTRRQQGLIHIHKLLCQQGRCPHCPFGAKILHSP